MHAFLIICQNHDYTQEKIAEITKKLHSQRLDFELVKIGQVKDLRNLTKISLGSKTTLVISDFDMATEETQNAFLKELEEPQQNLTFILTAKTSQGVLPTIVSRCELIEINDLTARLTPDQEKYIASFLNFSQGEKLKLVASLKDRQQAIDFLTNFLIYGHAKLVQDKDLANTLSQAQSTLSALKRNGNVALQLTNFVIQSSY